MYRDEVLRLLHQVRGVTSARIDWQGGKPERVQLLVQGDPDAILRDVQTALFALTGYMVPQRAIRCVSRHQEAPWRPGSGRWLIDGVRHGVREGKDWVSVTLLRGEQRIEGLALGPHGKDPLRLTALACAHAAEQALGGRWAVQVSGLAPVSLSGRQVMLVSLRLAEPNSEDVEVSTGGVISVDPDSILYGAAEFRGDGRESVVRAMLNALNRYLDAAPPGDDDEPKMESPVVSESFEP